MKKKIESDDQVSQEVLEAFSPLEEIKKEASESYKKFVRNADRTSYIHSDAGIAAIVAATNEMAAANPHIQEHSTFIVSFPARVVTQIKVGNGHAVCIDKGYKDKK